MIRLIHAQQEELDAVLVFRKLASLLNDDPIKALFCKVAEEERGHAVILQKITGKELEANNSKVCIVGFLFRFWGMTSVLKLLAKGEFKSAACYRIYAVQYPELTQIAGEELQHSRQLKALMP